jgi:signal transduction histidine kinase
MRALVEQARRIGGGDFAYRSTIRQNDEVGVLARELEAMSDRLAEAAQTLASNNEERIRVLEQLRHADRLTTVGTLAAGVAHELGTPLNVAVGHAKMIASGNLKPEQVTNGARIIAAQVDRMVRILRQLLDFARRGESAKKPTELGAIAERTTSLLETLARRRGVAIELSCEDRDGQVLADAPQLEQVLTNLIVNGIQAMDQGVLRVRVERSEETPPPDHGGPKGEFFRVDVRDEGPGIAKELLPRVFEPFFTTKPVGEGTGLGLSVAYGIVRDHGGWMSVTSEPGGGTVFSVHLPPLGVERGARG